MSAGVLATLIGVDYLGNPMLPDSLAKQFGLRLFLQAVGYLPTDNISAVQINNSRQIHEAVAHRYITDVISPYLVGKE